MRLTIAYSKIKKKRNLVLINNVTHQRETLTGWPIRLPLKSVECCKLNHLQMLLHDSVHFWCWLFIDRRGKCKLCYIPFTQQNITRELKINKWYPLEENVHVINKKTDEYPELMLTIASNTLRFLISVFPNALREILDDSPITLINHLVG